MTQQTHSFAAKWLLLIWAGIASQLLYADEPNVPASDIGKEITAIIATKQHPYLKQANFANRSEDLDALYKLANYKLLWLDNPSAIKNAGDAFALLNDAPAQGLIQENYDVGGLRKKYDEALSLKPTDYKNLALFDTALSIAVLRFLHDVHYGRVNPHGINFNLTLREKKLADFPALIKDSLFLNIVAKLPPLVEPKLQQYQKLKSALATYRFIAEKSPAFKFILNGKLKPGEQHPQLAELANFLVSLGDFSYKNTVDSTTKLRQYTPDLVAGIKNFQRRHGLTPDGVIRPTTVAALNEPLTQKIKQIELAMERLRWLPELNIGRSIIVNIPAFQLWAIDDINNTDINITNMRVVVGKALKNQTPVLMAHMSYVEFMPYWNVPKNILKDEIIPKLSKNLNYLASQNMEMISSKGNPDKAKPIPVNSESIAKLEKGVYRVRQKPGNRNSLGKVKFIFPNKDEVYLHDTPANSLFRKLRRDFSHGCVRVENPRLLAEFALKNQGNWNTETIKKAMQNPVTQRVDLKHPIPVLLFYTTTFIDQHNNLAFYPDIYGHDAVLLEALKKNDDLPDQSIFISSTHAEPSAVKSDTSAIKPVP
ncbi:MAG: L,D-transpeptidase family protein [Methyloglobulus sp.]|nr:L,D-transpeptidase family protein [Methyloglobulus sp.]